MMNGEMLRCKNEHVRPRGVIEKNLQVCLITIIVIAMTVFLTSCPNPLPPELVTQINDTDGPVITIAEPADRSEYSTVVRVSGTVTDGTGQGKYSADCRMQLQHPRYDDRRHLHA
jgi:hypothetical protein